MTTKPKISKTEINRIRKSAESIALGAGEILKDGFNRKKRVSFKGRIDPVTEFDLKSEKYILSRINSEFAEHSILSEEAGSNQRDSDFRWIIDPLDGTVNYSHGFPVYSVSIALEYRGTVIVAVVFDPERDELFSAALGCGARLNNTRISVSGQSRLSRSMLSTGFAYDIATARKNNIGYFSRVIKKAQAVRRAGSAALDLCWLAAGRFDGFWELRLAPWDAAAGLLIVQEAGGKITRIDGGRYSIYGNDILATNGNIHRSLRTALIEK